MKKTNHTTEILTNMLLLIMLLPFVSPAQSGIQKKDNRTGVLAIAYFIESANNSVSSLNSLLKKDNYRNKITTLNNPANNELGFSLKNEILIALKPILDKAKKTDNKKFTEVINYILSSPEENSLLSIRKFIPAAGIFSTIMSLVGNLVIAEKSITRDDLEKFIARVQQYFIQYEKLNQINEQFGVQLNRLLDRSEEMKADIKDFLVECITTLDKKNPGNTLKEKPVEVLMQKFYDPQKLQLWMDTIKLNTDNVYSPPDAPTTVKQLTTNIKKLQKEFETLYSENYRQLKELITSLNNTVPGLDKEQLQKTNNSIDRLYNESRQADVINLNLSLVDERMNTVCRLIFLPSK